MSTGAVVEDRPRASPGDARTEERVFQVLANRRRRYALHYLLRNEAPFELGELADHVAAWENETTPAAVTAAQRKRAYTALQQNHLPQMDELGFIEYDRYRGTIELTDGVDDLDIYLEVVGGRSIPWSDYYLGLAALSVALVVASRAGVFPLAAIPDAGWSLFVAVAFGVSAVAHKWYSVKLGAGEVPPEASYEGSSGRGSRRPK